MKILKPKTISIVIPTHNRVRKLQQLLKSIEKLNSIPNEVIVVNDGSKDQTKIFLKKWELQPHDFISIVFNNITSLGPGAARNIGIQLATSEVIAFTDDDCIVLPSWISSIKNSTLWNEKKIAGIGGKVNHYRKNKIL